MRAPAESAGTDQADMAPREEERRAIDGATRQPQDAACSDHPTGAGARGVTKRTSRKGSMRSGSLLQRLETELGFGLTAIALTTDTPALPTEDPPRGLFARRSRSAFSHGGYGCSSRGARSNTPTIHHNSIQLNQRRTVSILRSGTLSSVDGQLGSSVTCPAIVRRLRPRWP
jgi:hypothetical protein